MEAIELGATAWLGWPFLASLSVSCSPLGKRPPIGYNWTKGAMRQLSAFVLAIAFAVALRGQPTAAFRSLATTDRGDLYFASGLALRGPKPPRGGFVFRYTQDKGLEWFAPDWGPVLGAPQVSGDGAV